MQNTSEETGDFIGNRIADKTKSQNIQHKILKKETVNSET